MKLQGFTVLEVLLVILILVTLVSGVRMWKNNEARQPPSKLLTVNPSPSEELIDPATPTPVASPTPISINVSGINLLVNRKEYSYSGMSSEGGIVFLSEYFHLESPSVLKSSIQEQLNADNSWTILNTVDQLGPTGNGWYRVTAVTEEPTEKVTFVLAKGLLFIVDEQLHWLEWQNILFSYPVDFPEELKTKTPPRWIVTGINSNGRKITQFEYENRAKALEELSPAYLASRGWVYSHGAPAVRGYTKYDKDLTFHDCPKDYLKCLNELFIILYTTQD